MEEKKLKKVRKFNVKKLLILLLTLYILVYGVYCLIKMPIKSIIINGTSIITDYEVITIAKIKDYPPMFKVSSNTLIKRIKKISLVKNVTVKKSINGVLTLNITENKILFLNNNTGKIVLENSEEIDNNNYLGIPLLLNYVPDNKYQDLVTGMSTIHSDIIKEINEIEYSQYKNKNDEVIDDERFLLRMNDGNTVFVNLPNIKRLNYYQDIILKIEKKGILYLDSDSDTNTVFEEYQK